MKKEALYPVNIKVPGVRISQSPLREFTIIVDKDHVYRIPGTLKLKRKIHSSGAELQFVNIKDKSDLEMLPRILSDLKELARVNESIGIATITLGLVIPRVVQYDLREGNLLTGIEKSFNLSPTTEEINKAIICTVRNAHIEDITCDINNIVYTLKRFKDPVGTLSVGTLEKYMVNLTSKRLNVIEEVAKDMTATYLADRKSEIIDLICKLPYKL